MFIIEAFLQDSGIIKKKQKEDMNCQLVELGQGFISMIKGKVHAN